MVWHTHKLNGTVRDRLLEPIEGGGDMPENLPNNRPMPSGSGRVDTMWHDDIDQDYESRIDPEPEFDLNDLLGLFDDPDAIDLMDVGEWGEDSDET